MNMRGTAVRLAGVSSVIAGLLLTAGHLAFWQLVPVGDDARAEKETQVIIVGLLWLSAHVAIAPALMGIHAQQYRRTGTLGGVGLVLGVGGTLGLAMAMLLVFPEIIGLQTDTVQEARIAVLLQATGELSVVSFLVGLLLVGTATILAGRLPRFSGTLLVVGSLLAPLALLSESFLTLSGVLMGTGLTWIGATLLFARQPATIKRSPAQPDLLSFWRS